MNLMLGDSAIWPFLFCILKANLDNNIIEQILSELISEKLIEMEISELKVSLSEEALANKIRSNSYVILFQKLITKRDFFFCSLLSTLRFKSLIISSITFLRIITGWTTK